MRRRSATEAALASRRLDRIGLDLLEPDDRSQRVDGLHDGSYLRSVVVRGDAGADRFERPRECAVGPGLDGDVADGGGLDGSGDDGQVDRVGGELAEELVLRTAADDVEHVDARAGEQRQPGGPFGRRRRRASRGCSAPSLAGRAAVRRAAAIRSGMPPGGMKAGSSTSIGRAADRHGSSGEEELVEVAAMPFAKALLEEPQPADVAEEPGAPVDPELVGEVGDPSGLGEHRGGELEADEGPRAAGDVGEPLGGGGDADDRGGSVVGADRHDGRTAGEWCRGRPRAPRAVGTANAGMSSRSEQVG